MATLNSEIQELEQLKAALIEKACKLRDELQRAQKNIPTNHRVPIENISKLLNDSSSTADPRALDKVSARLCEASQSVLGIQFKDVQKNWSHENIYRYEALVVTKAIQFMLELTVDVKDHGEDEIQDINCHFANINQNYLQEIIPWMQRFTKERQFSYLMSAVSDYSEQSVIRVKILGSINSKGYLTLEKCNEEDGGILIYIHPPNDPDKIFFKIQWYTKFVDKTWRIEHIFVIDSVQADEDFVRENKELLQSFCRIGLTETDLEELWNKLCLIIDDEK